jgi:uncharacterized membrane-anchored protein YjiN (DUF445 family)
MQPDYEQLKSDLSDNSPQDATKEYARRLWDLLKKHTGKSPILEEKPRIDRQRPLPKPVTRAWVLTVLQIFPYVLGIVFLSSFFWDFPGMESVIWGHSIHFDGILRIISVSGLIGYGTNWLAITMLFRPEKRHPLLGHGLIPSQKQVIAFRLAQAVSTDLINPELIKQKISDSNLIPLFRDKAISWLRGITDDVDFRDELKGITVEYMRDLVADPSMRSTLAANIIRTLEQSMASKKLEKLALQTYLMVRGNEAQEIVEEAIARIPENIERMLDKVDHTLDELPAKLEERSDQIESIMTQTLYRLINQLDVHNLIEENINRFEEKRLEKMIKGATNEQLRYIQYLGAVLGTIGGLVIWSPLLALSFLGVSAAIVVGLDHLLMVLDELRSKS